MYSRTYYGIACGVEEEEGMNTLIINTFSENIIQKK